MTQQQRANVWQRKLQLKARLDLTTDKKEREQVKAMIEACNQELITGNFNPPKDDD